MNQRTPASAGVFLFIFLMGDRLRRRMVLIDLYALDFVRLQPLQLSKRFFFAAISFSFRASFSSLTTCFSSSSIECRRISA